MKNTKLTEILIISEDPIVISINKNGKKFTIFTLQNNYICVMPEILSTTPTIIPTNVIDNIVPMIDELLIKFIKSNNIILDLEELKNKYIIFDQNILRLSYKAYEIILNKFNNEEDC